MSLNFHIYSLFNVLIIGYFGQEFKFFIKGYKRKTRFFLLLILSLISFVCIILFDTLVLKSIPTLIYDVFLTLIVFSLMLLRNVNVYKTMQKAGRKKEVKKLNIVFNIVIILMVLLPFIAMGIYTIISGSKTINIINEHLSYAMIAIFAYLGLSFIILMIFGNIYHKHYLNQVNEENDHNPDNDAHN